MAEARVTLVGALAEVEAAGAVCVSLAGCLVELGTAQVRVSLVGVLVELVVPRPSAGGDAAARAGAAATAAGAAAAGRTVSAAAAKMGDGLFAALAASLAGVRPGTALQGALAAGAGATGGSGAMGCARSVVAQVLVMWDGVNWSDESGRFVSCRGSQGLIAPEQLIAGGRGQVGSCQITLSNADDRFSGRNAASPLFAHLAAGGAYLRPVVVNVTIDGVQERLLTGVVRELSEQAATGRSAATVSLDCRTRDELLLQDKRSTPLGDFLLASGTARTEDRHIVALLDLAGLVDGVDFVSQAWAAAHPPTRPTIDAGVFPVRYVWLDDESVLDELWGLVAACCGWFYCDVWGVLHYHNVAGVTAAGLARQYGPVTTLELDEGQVAGLRLGWPTADLYGEVTVEVSPRSPGPLETVWEPDDVVVVQPGQSMTIWARLDCALAAQPELVWQAYTAGGMAIGSGVSVSPTWFCQRVKLAIVNTGSRAAYLNVLRLEGQTLEGGRSVEVSAASEQAFWASRPLRRRSVRGNVYVQQEYQARTLAAYLLARSELPVLTVQVPNVDRADVRLGRPVVIE